MDGWAEKGMGGQRKRTRGQREVNGGGVSQRDVAIHRAHVAAGERSFLHPKVLEITVYEDRLKNLEVLLH